MYEGKASADAVVSEGAGERYSGPHGNIEVEVVESGFDETPNAGWARWYVKLKPFNPAGQSPWTERNLTGVTGDIKCDKQENFELGQGGRADSHKVAKRKGWFPFIKACGLDPMSASNTELNRRVKGKKLLAVTWARDMGVEAQYRWNVEVGDWLALGTRVAGLKPFSSDSGVAPGTERLADEAALPMAEEAPSAAPVGARDIGSR